MRSSIRLLSLVLLLAPAAPARATIDAPSHAVLDRYEKAVGRPANSVRTKSTLKALGLSGTVETFSERPDKQASVTVLGPFKLSTGNDGARAWRTEPGSGKLVILDGKDLEDARASAWFDNEDFLLPNEGGGAITSAGPAHDSTGHYQVLEVTPPAGKPRRLWFDDATGLLVRVEGKQDQQSIVSTFSDYREAGGRKVPGRVVTTIVGMPQNTLEATLDSVWVDTPIAAATFAPPGGATGTPVRWLARDGVAQLPFAYRGKHLWVRASVNGGPPADFIFDTGASITVLDSAYAARIGITTQGYEQGQGAGATGGASFAQLDKLKVTGVDDGADGIELAGTRVAVLSVNPVLAPFFWREAAGIIGFDVIGRFVNEIDYDRSVLTFHDPKSFQYAGAGKAIPMTLSNHIPVVKMTLDGRYTGDFRLDVGSSSTVDLHTPFVKANALAGRPGRSVEVMGGGFGGTFTNRVIRMKHLAIGPFAWDAPIVSLAQAQSGAFTSEDYAGNVGNRILERFKVTLDYDRRTLYLEPGARYKDPDRFARAGLQLALRDSVVQAMSVLPQSPAFAAGLREGDEVLSIDGRPIREWNPDTITDTIELGKVGTTHKVEYRRDGRTQVAMVKLKDIL